MLDREVCTQRGERLVRAGHDEVHRRPKRAEPAKLLADTSQANISPRVHVAHTARLSLSRGQCSCDLGTRSTPCTTEADSDAVDALEVVQTANDSGVERAIRSEVLVPPEGMSLKNTSCPQGYLDALPALTAVVRGPEGQHHAVAPWHHPEAQERSWRYRRPCCQCDGCSRGRKRGRGVSLEKHGLHAAAAASPLWCARPAFASRAVQALELLGLETAPLRS
mmetsp:Transcript_83397/g.239528  ORF Transcript_83397/g.239528 Transcript_83397/m.239528 type:complete len:222 (-) Transcript_83397:724-1389(-)